MAVWQQVRQRERAERLAAFTGECTICFDEGECRFCERGQRCIARSHAAEVTRFLVDSGISPRCIDFSFETYPNQSHPALAAVRSYVDTYDGTKGLILTGKYGTGKTGLLVAALREFASVGIRSFRFTTGPDLFDMLRQGYDKGDAAERLHRIQATRLLVIDDLGAEKPSEWTHERVFSIVNHRYENQLPTWVSTNCDMETLSQRIGERSVWRLAEMSMFIEVNGANLRAKGSAR